MASREFWRMSECNFQDTRGKFQASSQGTLPFSYQGMSMPRLCMFYQDQDLDPPPQDHVTITSVRARTCSTQFFTTMIKGTPAPGPQDQDLESRPEPAQPWPMHAVP